MITIKLCGGLGNQLFQYAFGYQLSQKVNTELALDLSWFKQQSCREPDILRFNIEYDKLCYAWEEDVLLKLLNKTTINRSLRIPGGIGYSFPRFYYLKESRYKYNKNIDSFSKNQVYVDGYWQCPKYFEKEYDKLVDLFMLKDIKSQVYEVGEKLKNTNSVAIHVRRGDYPTKKKPGIRLLAIGDEYYRMALANFVKRCPDCKIYLFSNDVKEGRSLISNITNKEVIVLSENMKLNALNEWYLMSCCKNQIIGNSTFSWWAAYLNKNKDKLVYAPDNYWGNDNIIPSKWIKLPAINKH